MSSNLSEFNNPLVTNLDERTTNAIEHIKKDVSTISCWFKFQIGLTITGVVLGIISAALTGGK